MRDIDINPLKFPRSFYFFSKLLDSPASFSWVSVLMVLFSYVQEFALSFLSFILEYRKTGTSSFPIKFLFAVLGFHSEYVDYYLIHIVGYVFFVVMFLFGLSILTMFIFFVRGYHINLFFVRVRGFLVFYVPGFFLTPLIFEASDAIRFYCKYQYSLFLGFAIFYACSILGFSLIHWWASPLLFETPLLGSSHLPSQLIPNSKLFLLLIVYYAVFAISFIGEYDLFFLVCSIFMGFIKFYLIWNYPFNDSFITSINLAMAISMIVNPILAKYGDYGKFWVFMTTLLIFFVFFIIFMYTSNKIKYQIERELRDSKHIPCSKADAFFSIQIAVNSNIINYFTRGMAEQVMMKYKDLESTLIYYFIEIISSESITSIDIMPLLHMSNLLYRPLRFFVFEIARSAKTKKINNINYYPNSNYDNYYIEKIKGLVDDYNENSVKFWSCMMSGDLGKGLDVIIKLTYKFNSLRFKFNLYQSFFKENEKVQKLIDEFFHYHNNYKQTDTKVKVHSMLYVRKESILFPSLMSEIQGPNDEHIEIDGISSNLKRLFRRKLPIAVVLLVSFLFISASLYIIFLFMPIFKIYGEIGFVRNLPSTLHTNVMIALGWSQIALAFSQLTKCTEFVNSSCDKTLNYLNSTEDQSIQCISIGDIIGNIVSMAESVQEGLRHVAIQYSNERNRLDESILDFWYHDVISIFPEGSNYSINTTIKSILLSFTTQILLYSSSRITCNSNITNHFSTERFFTVSTEIESLIFDSLSMYRDFISNFRHLEGHKTYEIALICLFGFLALMLSPLTNIVSRFLMYSTGKKYFRPSVHPISNNIPRSPYVLPLRFPVSSFLPFFIALFYFFLIILEFSIGWYFSRLNVIQLANLCNVILAIESVSLQSSITISSLFKAIQYPNSTVFLKNSISKLSATQNFLLNSLSPANIGPLVGPDIPSPLKNRCTHENGNHSMHDIYRCWPVPRQILLLSMYVNQIFLNNEVNLSSLEFYHTLHIYLTHAVPMLTNLSIIFNDYSYKQIDKIVMLTNVQIMLFVFFITTCGILSLFFSANLSSYFRQISRMFYVLNPIFVASQQCLMAYALHNYDGNEEKNVFDALNISLVLVSDNFSILSFTSPLRKMFGYTKDQLIGQRLGLLISKKEDKFYNRMNMILRREAEDKFTMLADGRKSDGEIVKLKVIVNFENNMFLIQCRSIVELFDNEEIALACSEMAEEISQKVMPIKVIPESKRRINKVLAIFMMVESTIAQSMNRIVENSQKYQNFIFLDNSPGSLFLLVPEYEHYIEDGWNFFNNIPGQKAGFIVEWSNVDVFLMPLPEVPEEYKMFEMPNELTKEIPHRMTIEPMSDLFQMFNPSITRNLKKDILVVTENVSNIIGCGNFQPLIICEGNNIKLMFCNLKNLLP